jgi:hypothetical protein
LMQRKIICRRLLLCGEGQLRRAAINLDGVMLHILLRARRRK